MKHIFVNLKRFDVPRKLGGVCPLDDPQEWISGVIQRSIELGLAAQPELSLVYLLPEGLVPIACQALTRFSAGQSLSLQIGCQGVHWEDIAPGKNFGAFTTAKPANAVKNLGSSWVIIGHSEERRFKRQVLEAYDPAITIHPVSYKRATQAINQLAHAEVLCALKAGLNVLYCVGETEQERGSGEFNQQQLSIQTVLQDQLLTGLDGVTEFRGTHKLVIGYEPVWAIGPGKTPPNAEYISFVANLINQFVTERIGSSIPVVYGGGLKEENASILAGIDALSRGLVGLTRFSGEIGFDVDGLKNIIDRYQA